MSSRRLLFVLISLFASASAVADIVVGSYGTGSSAESLRVFADTATGDAAPTRVFTGPATGFTSTSGGTFEPAEGVVYVADFWGQAIRVFPAYASGDVAPLRVLTSPFIGQVRTVAVDPVHDELLAIGGGCCLMAFARTASGATGPLRSLSWGGGSGSVTQLNYPGSLSYMSPTDEVVLADSDASAPYAPKLLVFNRTDSGNTAPKRVIRGAQTGLGSWISSVVHDPAARQLLVFAHVDNPDSTRTARILVFDDQADGNALPVRTIGGPGTTLDMAGTTYPGGLAIDPVRARLIVTIADYAGAAGNRVLVFDLAANGNSAPLQVIEGPQSTLALQLGAPIWMPTDRIMAHGFE